jgi:hypothetical protein
VALVFFAIVLWAGPILVPEMVARWEKCQGLASTYKLQARAYSLKAARFTSSNPRRMALLHAKAADCEKESQKYRRAFLIPWECWSLGQ